MKLPAATAALSGFTDVYKLNADTITALTSGQAVQIAVVPPGACITNCVVTKTQAHAGTSTDLKLDVGVTGGDTVGLIEDADLVGLTKTIAAQGAFFGIGLTAATVTINPTGSDNSVLYTAPLTLGSEGNEITITYATPAAQFTTTVGVFSRAITVTAGTKARMTVTGTLTSDGATPVVFEDTVYAGLDEGVYYWSSDGEIAPPATGDWYSASGSAGGWVLAAYTDEVLVAAWDSAENVASPDLVVTWIPNGAATGTPTVTAGISNAQQVIDAVNADADASALVTASASGTVTGAVAAVASTPLTGGVSGAGSVNIYANNTASDLQIGAIPTFTGTVTGGEYLICLTILNPGILAEV